MLTRSIDLGTMSACQLFRLCLLSYRHFLPSFLLLTCVFVSDAYARATPDSPPSQARFPEVHCDLTHYALSFSCSNFGHSPLFSAHYIHFAHDLTGYSQVIIYSIVSFWHFMYVPCRSTNTPCTSFHDAYTMQSQDRPPKTKIQPKQSNVGFQVQNK